MIKAFASGGNGSSVRGLSVSRGTPRSTTRRRMTAEEREQAEIDAAVDRELRKLGYSGMNDPRVNRMYASKFDELADTGNVTAVTSRGTSRATPRRSRWTTA